MNIQSDTYKEFVQHYLNRSWEKTDGLPNKEIETAEARLGIALPASLRGFYLIAGAVQEFCSIHNVIFSPQGLEFEDGYLMFADENQSVVSWGMKKSELKTADPVVWQRNNNADKWYSEEKSFVQFLKSMFDFYESLGVWAE